MESKQALWSETYKVTSLLVNPAGKLGLFGLLNLLQETSWIHAEHLGFGVSSMEQHGLYWVVTRQHLKVHSWANYGDKLTIQTWVRAPEGSFTAREFKVLDEAGKEVALCTSTFIAIDRTTKKLLAAHELQSMESFTLTQATGLVAEKIAVAGDYEILAQFQVRNSDLDINQHVNNTKYAQWVLDAIPYQFHKTLRLKSYAVNFLAETFLGDTVRIERDCHTIDVAKATHGVSTYRGIRIGDEKVLFTSQLEWERRS